MAYTLLPQVTIETTDTIQDYIDDMSSGGGGTVVLTPGTYTLLTDLTVPSNVYLKGAIRDTTIIDFNAGAHSLKIIGANAYTTGTVDTTDGSANVTGHSTVWTGGMVGQTMFLNDSYYTIMTVTNATHIVLDTPYSGTALSGATYAIADAVSNILLEELTVQNSSIEGVNCQYVIQSFMRNVNAFECGTGMKEDHCVAIAHTNITADGSDTNLAFTNCFAWTMDNTSITNAAAGNNFTITNNSGCTFFNNLVDNASADGIHLTGSSSISFLSNTVTRNGGQGFEFVSGNSAIDIGSTTIDGNASDGVKLTASSDQNNIHDNTITNNGGYGVNIVVSGDDDNLIIGNIFDGNSTAAVNDSGTGTLIRSNVGQADN